MRQNLNRMPVLVGLGSLLVYLLTLSFGVSANSLGITANVAGWDWQPMVGMPLTWLVTLPFRILPAAWVPPALNLFTALCASLTLAILARSMELLPWFRPLDTLAVWKRRLPVLLAVIVCGLQFHFWQQATNATGEMLDLLVFASSVWCLLEYRLNKASNWLQTAVLLWGLGMTENWMMIVTLLLFIVWLVWLQPMQFLNWRLPARLAMWGLLGFSIYLLLPLTNSLSPHSPWSFGEAWIASFKQTKQLLGGLRVQFWAAHRLVGLAVMLFYLLPVLSFLVRLPDEQTENKSPLDQLQIWLFRGLRAGLLLLCLWLALDPVVGPRGLIKHQMNLSLPLLSFDYLDGLAAGFLAGNLLLVERKKSDDGRYYRLPGDQLFIWLERTMLPLVLGLLSLMAVGLIVRNAPVVARANGQPLSQFGELALRGLPDGGGVIFSDYPEKLVAFQAAQAKHGGARGWLAVDTRSLPLPAYRERLEKMKPGFWLLSTNRHSLSPSEQTRLLDSLVLSNRVFYLHPSFGYFFEAFYQVPSGAVFELKEYRTNSVNPPPLTSEQLLQNEKRWNAMLPQIQKISDMEKGKAGSLSKKIASRLHLETPQSDESLLLGEWYSLAVDSRGVDLQRAGKLSAANDCFALALELSPNNWVARANLFCNTNLQATNKMALTSLGALAGQLGTMQKFAVFLGRFGPVDEPQFCYLLGDVFVQSALPRQALQQLERAAELAPDVLAPRLALANLYVRCRLYDQASNAIVQLRASLKKIPETRQIETGLAMLEADLCLSQTNLAGASKIYQSVLRQHPDDRNVENGILKAYVAIGDFTNAEKVVSGMLSQRPDDVSALLAKSGVLIESGRAGEAIPVLDQILAVTNSLPAKVNRAIAYLQTTNTAAAKKEYTELQSLLPSPFFANLGLAEVALQEQDTNQAVQLFKQCLTNAPSLAEQRLIRARLEAIQQSAVKTNNPATK